MGLFQFTEGFSAFVTKFNTKLDCTQLLDSNFCFHSIRTELASQKTTEVVVLVSWSVGRG